MEKLKSRKTGKGFLFEAQVCGRCGGCGEYSFNQMDGSRCYGCGGHGIKLTKRGLAAQAFFEGLCSLRTDELVTGLKVRILPGPFSGGGWATVTEITEEEGGTFAILTDLGRGSYPTCSHQATPADRTWRVAQSAEGRREKAEEAREYEASLTKAGTARKRKVTG